MERRCRLSRGLFVVIDKAHIPGASIIRLRMFGGLDGSKGTEGLDERLQGPLGRDVPDGDRAAHFIGHWDGRRDRGTGKWRWNRVQSWNRG
jgi:hypothetical protein